MFKGFFLHFWRNWKIKKLKLYHVPRKHLVNVSWLYITQRWQGGHQGQNYIRIDRVIQIQAGRPQWRRGNRAHVVPPKPQGTRRPAPEPNPRACPGSPGERHDSPGGSGQQGGPRRARGSSWDTVSSLRDHESSADFSWGRLSRSGTSVAALWCPTARTPHHPASWLSATKSRAPAAEGHQGACPCTGPARARGEAPPRLSSDSLWLAARIWAGSRARGATGSNPQSLNEPGRGGASSGRDTTAGFFKARQAPSLTCFFVIYLLLFAA